MTRAERLYELASKFVVEWDSKYKRVPDDRVLTLDIESAAGEIRSRLEKQLKKRPKGRYQLVTLVDLSVDDPISRNDWELDEGLYEHDFNAFEEYVCNIAGKVMWFTEKQLRRTAATTKAMIFLDSSDPDDILKTEATGG